MILKRFSYIHQRMQLRPGVGVKEDEPNGRQMAEARLSVLRVPEFFLLPPTARKTYC